MQTEKEVVTYDSILRQDSYKLHQQDWVTRKTPLKLWRIKKRLCNHIARQRMIFVLLTEVNVSQEKRAAQKIF